ncbi:hypothetical protein CU097_011145, partial [Rhizopus azygosporus]
RFLPCFPRHPPSFNQKGGSYFLPSTQKTHAHSCRCSSRDFFSRSREICRVRRCLCNDCYGRNEGL